MKRLGGVSLAELRRQFGGGEKVSLAVVKRLEQDERRGARALAGELAKRRKRESAERRRVRALFRTERALRAEGVGRIAGVDEVGMGPLAGPVIAAAVVLPAELELPGLNDSKQLTPAARERLDELIRGCALDVALGRADPEEIDRINIYQAGLVAMRRAVLALERPPEMVLVDARHIPELAVRQRREIGGDERVGSIAAASVVAKVWRDRLMGELDRSYPGYGFGHNAGYATAEHLDALRSVGPTPIHRRSFAPVRAAGG